MGEDVGPLLVLLVEELDRLIDVADRLQMELIRMEAGIV